MGQIKDNKICIAVSPLIMQSVQRLFGSESG